MMMSAMVRCRGQGDRRSTNKVCADLGKHALRGAGRVGDEGEARFLSRAFDGGSRQGEVAREALACAACLFGPFGSAPFDIDRNGGRNTRTMHQGIRNGLEILESEVGELQRRGGGAEVIADAATGDGGCPEDSILHETGVEVVDLGSEVRKVKLTFVQI